MSRFYSRFKTIIASILIACIVLNLFPLSLLALDEPYYSVSDEYEFSVTRVISSRWEDHANIDFTITNNGDTTINNWYITTDLLYEVENIWNASIAEASDRYITISSAPQNQPIEPGCSVTFGITGYSEDDSLFDVESSFYLLNVEDVIIPVEKYQATTNVYSTTEEGFSGAIAITNISSELLTIENVVLNSTNGLTTNGNAAIEDETTLVVDSSSRNIYPSASIYINFEGTNEIPEVVNLRYTGLAFTLTEDEDNDGILDIDEFLYPEEEPEVTPTPTITPSSTPVVEPTETPTVTPEEEPTPSTTPEVEEPTPTPEDIFSISNLSAEELLSDNDRDGLTFEQEYMYGTNPDYFDTDTDGISDGTEIYMGYDPLLQDSDSNGILDLLEDCDGDGIVNGDEISLGSCVYLTDTDFDDICDYDEIYVYNSDPRNEDSDGDGIHDGDELILGKNPMDSSDFGITVNQTISQEINNVEDLAITSVDVTMDYVGNMESSVSVDDLYNIDTYSTAIYSRIGSPLGFNSEFEFDSATVVIHYDDTMLGDTSEDRLGVLWFDEEHGVYIVQEQAIIDAEQNTVTLELEHFSTYVLVDIDEWRNAFNVPETSNGCFVVEYSTYYFVMGGLTNEDKIEAAYTVDEYEQRCFNMWANSAGNYRRNYELVARISGNRTQVDSMQFVHDYVWLVRDVTDRDNDGLYDCYESEGMLLSNGTITCTSPNGIDSDGDGISDFDEMDVYYEITRDVNGKITVRVNGEIVISGVYYINASSPYYFLNDYINTSSVTTENPLLIWVPKSDPNNPDTDSDGYKDYEDARIWTVNEKVIYLFYLALEEGEITEENEKDLNFMYRSALMEQAYELRGHTVICEGFHNREEFLMCWESIGMSQDYDSEGPPYDYRYYYDAEHVVINTHGLPDTMQLGQSQFLVSDSCPFYISDFDYFISDLQDRVIGTLNLHSCRTGEHINYGNNVATEFLVNFSRIEQVVAPDTSLISSPIDDSNLTPYHFVCYEGELQNVTLQEYLNRENYYVGEGQDFLDLPGIRNVNVTNGFLRFYRENGYVSSTDVFNNDMEVVSGTGYIYTSEEDPNDVHTFVVYNSSDTEPGDALNNIHFNDYILSR